MEIWVKRGKINSKSNELSMTHISHLIRSLISIQGELKSSAIYVSGESSAQWGKMVNSKFQKNG